MTYKFFSLWMALVVAALPAQATEVRSVKLVKQVVKTYTVTSSDRLDIRSSYGTVHVETWDKPEFSITVDMEAVAPTEGKAQELLNQVDIRITEDPGRYTFETVFKGNLRWNDNQRVNIRYTIKMPTVNPLALNSSYGSAYVSDFKGPINVRVAYGSLKTGVLSNTVNDVKVQYGSADITGMAGGTLEMAYAKGEVGRLNDVNTNVRYSKLEVDDVTQANADLRYSEMEMGEVGKLNAKLSYSGLEIEELTTTLVISCQYAPNVKVHKLHKGFQSVTIDGDYSSVSLVLAPGAGAELDITTRYGGLRIDSSLPVQYRERVSESTRTVTRGHVGSAGGGKITATIDYGDVRIKPEDDDND